MRKINCDFCGKDISNYEENVVPAFYRPNDNWDLCNDCEEKCWKLRDDFATEYAKKMEEARLIVENELNIKLLKKIEEMKNYEKESI